MRPGIAGEEPLVTQALQDWKAAGRPFRDARPILELIAMFKSHHVGFLGDLGNKDHLENPVPKDHTPFPKNPWPIALPPKPAGYIVCACDHAKGHWADRMLADARAGRLPWLKYLNFGGHHYDVRNGWKEESSGDDHLHISIRSDWIDRSIGGYDPVAGTLGFGTAGLGTMGDDVSWNEIITNQLAQQRQGGGGAAKDWLINTAFRAEDMLATLKAGLAAEAVRDQAILAALQTSNQSGGADTAAIIAAVNAVRAEAEKRFEELEMQLSAEHTARMAAEARADALESELNDARAPRGGLDDDSNAPVR
jgi:hypothetical protein